MRTPSKILHTEDDTVHLVFTDLHSIQTANESPARSHWSAHNKSWYLENLKKTTSVFPNVTITQFYHVGHDTYFKQMLTSTETTCEEQNDRTSPMSGRLLVEDRSSFLNERLVFRPASLDLTALDLSTTEKTIEQKTQQMQWRMIVSSGNDCRTETAQTLSNFWTGSHSWQHGGREFF